MLERVAQHARRGIKIELSEEHHRAQRNRILHNGQKASEGFGDLVDRQRQPDNAIPQQRRFAGEAVRIVEDRSSGLNLARVSLYGVLVEGHQKVQVVAVGVDLLLADSDPEPDVAAADDGLVAVVGIDVEAHAGDAVGQSVAGLVESVSRRRSNADGKLALHSLPSCLTAKSRNSKFESRSWKIENGN